MAPYHGPKIRDTGRDANGYERCIQCGKVHDGACVTYCDDCLNDAMAAANCGYAPPFGAYSERP